MPKQTTPMSFIPWITGNITPASWYHKILKPSGFPDFVAISILADVINWYQPTKDGKQKFKADKLQKNYQAYANMINVSKDTVKKAFDCLEAQGLIKREFRIVETVSGLIMTNMMYISPMIDNIKYITINTDTKNGYPPVLGGEYPPVLGGDPPPVLGGDPPPVLGGDVYGKNGNNHVSKNDGNCEAQNFGQEELSPAVVLKTIKVNNVETSQQIENLSIAEFNKRKFHAVIELIPEKYKEPFVLSYLKKSIAKEDYTEEYYKNAIIYTNDHARGETKQYRSYLGKTIDNQWAVNYVSKVKKVGMTDEEKLERARQLPTSFLVAEEEKGDLFATQALKERSTERLLKEYEETGCLAVKRILVKQGALPEEEPNKKIIINNFTMPALKTDSEKKANLERQKQEMRKLGWL